MNKAILIGRLTRDPEIRYTQTGKAVATFSLAVDRRGAKDGNGPKADFIPIVAWDKLAEVIGNNLSKGRRVMIEGRIQIRSYEAQDGTKRYVTEIIAQELEFLDSRNDTGQQGNTPGGFGGSTIEDEEIPF